MDNRKYPRFSFKEAVEYQRGETPASGSLAADISDGGVRIRVQEFIPLRTVVAMKIHMGNPVRAVPMQGQVVWVREVPQSESFDVGIRFIKASRFEQ